MTTTAMRGWNAARAVAVLRFARPVDSHFVRLCLLSPPLQQLMKAWATTTVQATLNLKEIRQLPLPWPPLAQREEIVRTLDVIEARVNLNHRLNRTLESMGLERRVTPPKGQQAITVIAEFVHENYAEVDAIIEGLTDVNEPLTAHAMQDVVGLHGRFTKLLRDVATDGKAPR